MLTRRGESIHPMTDVFTKQKRSEVMASIRSTDTRPERLLWAALGMLELKVTRHAVDVPGRPDAAIHGKQIAIFVNGCFWHGHKRCTKGRVVPKTNGLFWRRKITENRRRDRAVGQRIRRRGWKRFVVWECQIQGKEALALRLDRVIRTLSCRVE